MKLSDLKDKIHPELMGCLSKEGIEDLRPSQEKSIEAGLFEGKNLLVCTPTASGKTLVGEFAALNSIFERKGKALYIVPLKALANEKYKEFKKKYPTLKISVSVGDLDSEEPYLHKSDLILLTTEKLDSLLRHRISWLNEVGVIVIDEVHLLDSQSRGPTLEFVITLLKEILSNFQLIALSATIGNPKELAEWLDASLIQDSWRPTQLKQGILLENEIEFLK